MSPVWVLHRPRRTLPRVAPRTTSTGGPGPPRSVVTVGLEFHLRPPVTTNPKPPNPELSPGFVTVVERTLTTGILMPDVRVRDNDATSGVSRWLWEVGGARLGTVLDGPLHGFREGLDRTSPITGVVVFVPQTRTGTPLISRPEALTDTSTEVDPWSCPSDHRTFPHPPRLPTNH